MARILLVDDEPGILKVLRTYLERESFEVLTAADATECFELFGDGDVDLMIVDLRLGRGMDGLDLMHEVHVRKRDLPIIMITAYGTIEVAVQAMKEGAFDFITKPFELEPLLDVVRAALERHAEPEEDEVDAEVAGEEHLHFGCMVGESEQMQRIYRIVERVAPTDATVLIEGESGTGKELVARSLHRAGKRAKQPMVSLNCAALPAALLESEMFGHAAGAFTGAVSARDGLFMEAHNGTLFLDEIGVMDVSLQGKLLRVLQEGRVRRIGENEDREVDVRVVAATNENLEVKMESGDFREDLFYRLSVIPIELPPLRRRGDDTALLVHHFCRLQSAALNRDITLDHGVMHILMNYAWPGNIRELQNAIACAATLCDNGVIRMQDLPPNIAGESLGPPETVQADPGDIGKSLREFLREK